MEQSYMTLLSVDKVLFAVLYLCSKFVGMVMQLLLVYLFDVVSLKTLFQINLDM